MILDSDELSKENELDDEDDPSVCEVTPLIPNLSLEGIRDATINNLSTDPVVPAVAATTSPRFSSFLLRPEEISSRAETPEMVTPGVPMEVTETSDPSMTAATQEDPPEGPFSITQNLVITRQEVFALTSVLGRLPQSMIGQPGPSSSGDITFNIVEDPPQSPTRNLTQQPRDQGITQESERPNGCSSCEETQVIRGKRQRPKYSLKPHMLRKHPVLKFFATGPMERSKTPYKWWCRVCRVELSLMSRGVLELLSHFKTDAHLVKEHRIRLETPGLPLFDRSQKELVGSALKEATKIAKEMYPIAPQLDVCRLLVGQDKLPDFIDAANPSEDVLSQIRILEQGLRHGGHVDSLVGMWDEMVRLFPGNSQASTYCWSRHRLFVSSLLFWAVLNLFLQSCPFFSFCRLFWFSCTENC